MTQVLKIFRQTQAFLFDLDGTLTIDSRPVPLTAAALAWLKSHGYPIRICTNTTTLSRATMSARLRDSGFPVEPQEIFSAPAAAVLYLRRHQVKSCCKLLSPDVRVDFEEFAESDYSAEYIVIGDVGEIWDYALMSRLFRSVMNGSKIITLHKGRYWLSGGELKIDIGAFIAGLEFATGATALVIGKPSPAFFELALDDLGIAAAHACMIGDDLINDVQGAQSCGIKGVLVRTGKYRQDQVKAANVKPDLEIDSVADLPGLLQS